MKNKELIVTFKETGFHIDTEYTDNKVFYYDVYLHNNLVASPYEELLYFGFLEKQSEMSVSLLFLHSIAARFIIKLTKYSETEALDQKLDIELSNDEALDILHAVPFVTGIEFITFNWVKSIWGKLLQIAREDIDAEFSGNVEDFLLSHKPNITVYGKVFFHLVENKSEEYPFAFLATYSTGNVGDKKASHTPRKNALIQYKDHNEELLKLLSTVSKAADKSEFISELVESGELFSPLKFTSDEAYIFLKEIPLYEECGILCRIPDWWRKKSNSFKLSVSVGDKAPSKCLYFTPIHDQLQFAVFNFIPFRYRIRSALS